MGAEAKAGYVTALDNFGFAASSAIRIN